MLLEVKGSGVDVTAEHLQAALNRYLTPLWRKYGAIILKFRVELAAIEGLGFRCNLQSELAMFGVFEVDRNDDDLLLAIAIAAEQLQLTLATILSDE